MREGVEHNGKKVPVYFAISADVSDGRSGGKIASLSESAWKPLRKLTEKGLIEGRKEWAELEFIPSAASVKKDMKPDRYLAIRVRPWQTELFSDANSYLSLLRRGHQPVGDGGRGAVALAAPALWERGEGA